MAISDSISSPLRDRLLTLRLCSERDLRRCRTHVRRLARDLPAFDSVWLDALIRIGALTPFQVRQLESDQPDRLTCGPWLLVSQLAAGSRGATFLARQPAVPTGRVAVKFIDCPASRAGELVAGFRSLIDTLRSADCIHLGCCSQCEPTPTGVVLISPYADGPTVGELLVRRGRFPPAVVAELARQMLVALATCEARGVVHGDVRTANVRLLREGVAVLVDGGIRPLIWPVETVHSGLSPEHFDGVAPELINTLNPPTHQSDLYALGCLLWQLLTGRSPFPAGDALIKMAAHQAREIPPLEDHAPETPPELRQLIRLLVERDLGRRPHSARQVLTEWKSSLPESQAAIRRFRREFDQPYQLRRKSSGVSLTGCLLGLAVLGAVAWGWPRWPHEGGPPGPQGAEVTADPEAADRHRAPAAAIARQAAGNERGQERQSGDDRVTGAAASPGPGDSPVAKEGQTREAGRVGALSGGGGLPVERTGLAPLPDPDEHGELVLTPGRRYLARPLQVVGSLVIRGGGTPPPRLVVRDPWKVVAESVRLDGLEIDGQLEPRPDPEATRASIDVHAQSLTARHVLFSCPPGSRSSGAAPPHVRWELIDNRDSRPTAADFQACQFQNGAAAVVLPQPVSAAVFRDCLMVGQGVLVELAGSSRSARQVAIRLERVTARAGGGVLRWWGDAGPPAGMQVAIDLRSTVVEAESAALITLISSGRIAEWRGRVRVEGDGALISPETSLLAWQSDTTGERRELDVAGYSIEGLMSVPLEFVGTRLTVAADSVLRSASGPRRSTQTPGFDPERLNRAGPVQTN